jgi:protein-tyrosine-phosphatase
VLEGQIEEFGTDSLIRLISSAQKSGRLELRRTSGRAELTFSLGTVCAAHSTFGEPLGLRLVGDGFVTRRRLRAALDEHVAQRRQLGQVLVEWGDIDSEFLNAALRDQLMDRILDLLDWETGSFKWTPVDEIRLDESPAVTAHEIFEERTRRNAKPAADSYPMNDHGRDMSGETGPERRPSLPLAHNPSTHVFDVVVVCTGNQFRSPIVEGLMRASTTRLPLRVTSVGTKDLDAVPAMPEAVDLASEFGIDLTAHRSRSLAGLDLSGADLVIGFEQAHIAAAVVEAGAAYERTFTILELISLLDEAPLVRADDPVERARAAVEEAHRMRRAGATLPVDAQIGDPVELGPSVYRETADRLRQVTRQLLDHLFGYVPLTPPPPPG